MQALDSLQLVQINFWTLAVVILFSCLTRREQLGRPGRLWCDHRLAVDQLRRLAHP